MVSRPNPIESPSDGEEDRRDDRRWAAVGGVIAAIVGFGAMALVGTASSIQARRLLDSILPTIRFAASSYVAGGATVLALMLTLITFSITNELDFKVSHYERIRDIAALTTVVIVASVALLMFLSFPLGQADVNRSYYIWLYYAILLGSAITGGMFIAVVLMLFYAVRGLIGVGIDEEASPLTVSADES